MFTLNEDASIYLCHVTLELSLYLQFTIAAFLYVLHHFVPCLVPFSIRKIAETWLKLFRFIYKKN